MFQSGNLKIDFDRSITLEVKRMRDLEYPLDWALFYKGYWSVAAADEKNRYLIQFEDGDE